MARASEILPAHLLRGSGYVVTEPVEIHDSRYLFRVSTDYGKVSALGMPMLELRLREHFSIQSLRRRLYSPLVFQGVIEAVKEAPAGALALLTDPIGSLLRYPQGIRLSLRSLIDPLERRGGGEVRRGLAHAVDADPETRNAVLAMLLDHLALRKTVGKVGTRMGLGKAVPILGRLASNAETREQVMRQSPRQIARDVTARLVGIQINQKVSKKFAGSMLMTSTEKLLAIVHFESLRGVRGLERLVASFDAVTTEAELLSYLQQLKMLSGLHQQDPIEFVQPLWITLARLHRGGVVAFAGVDILQHSERLCETIDEFSRATIARSASLLVAGTVVSAARASLSNAGIRVIDLSRYDAVRAA